MLIVRVIVSCIQVTTDTLKIQLFLVVIIIEVSSYALIGNTFRIDIDMTSLTRFIVDDFLCIFQFTFAIPVNVFLIFGKIRPNILHASLHLGSRIIQSTFRGKVTSRTISLHTTLAIVVYRLLPSLVGICMIMTRHTRFI